MEKYYSFAGLELAVSVPDEWMYKDDGMLAPFRVDSVNDPHWLFFSMVESLSPPTGNLVASIDNFMVYWDGNTRLHYVGVVHGKLEEAYMRTLHQGKTHTVELRASAYPSGMTSRAVLHSMNVAHLIADIGGFLFHSSYIDIGGKAILFTAPSGTGKSTQADLWRDLRGARILNGDRSIVRCAENGIVACGIPFMGSSPYCENVTLPLAGIVCLAQAPQTTIRRITGVEAFRQIWEGVGVNTWDKEDISKVLNTVMNVISTIPIWYLACTPDETAVAALEQQLGK